MVKIIDIQFLGVKSAIACFLIKSSKGLIMIETGPAKSYKIISQELNNLGYNIKEVKHVFLTHIHLDHSGGAWKFSENGAKIYVHPFSSHTYILTILEEHGNFLKMEQKFMFIQTVQNI